MRYMRGIFIFLNGNGFVGLKEAALIRYEHSPIYYGGMLIPVAFVQAIYE